MSIYPPEEEAAWRCCDASRTSVGFQSAMKWTGVGSDRKVGSVTRNSVFQERTSLQSTTTISPWLAESSSLENPCSTTMIVT